jgi:moderate conductance mechanosensitive channel
MTALMLSPPACVDDVGSWCAMIYGLTGNPWLATYSGMLVGKPLAILAIALVALFLRWLLHRMIDRLTRGDGRTPRLLRPLKERRGDPTSAELVAERRIQRAKTVGSVLKSTVSFVLFGLAAIYVLQQLGVELAPLLASAGVVGVAVAFGAQTLVRDFLAGLVMMIEDQYGVGDVVDLSVTTGTIESVGLRITTLRDVNGTVWYVRNGEIRRVGNSSQGFAVAVVDFPIPPTGDIQKAIDVAEKTATEATAREPLSRDVLEPPTMLGVDAISLDTVTLRLTVKVRPGTQWATQRTLRAEIKRAYDAENIHPPASS